jgi:hypothetical protein
MVTLGLLTTKNYAMKKFLIALALTIGSTNFGNAQIDKTDNPTEEAQEKLQQEPPRQTQSEAGEQRQTIGYTRQTQRRTGRKRSQETSCRKIQKGKRKPAQEINFRF